MLETTHQNMKKRFIIILSSVTAIRLVIIAFIGLINDEAYYWVWSRHPSLSYYDHPPMIAWVIRVFTGVLGSSPFTIHLVGLLFITSFTVILYAWAKEMFSARDALWGTVTVLFTPLFFLGGSVLTPDAILSFFWVITLYAVFRALKSRKHFYWYWAGIAAGLGAITKYSIFFLPAAVFLYLIFSNENRWWLKKKEPYISFLLMVVIFAPVLVWNARNDWVSFTFHLVSRHNVYFSAGRFLRFIVSQMVHISPVAYIYCWISFFLLFLKGFKNKDWISRYLFFMSFPLVAGFSLSTFYTDALSHWPVFGYVGGLIAIPAIIKSRNKNKVLVTNIVLSVVIITVFAGQVIYPFFSIKKDPTNDVHGWSEVGKQTTKIYSTLPDESFLLCARYETGGQLSFAVRKEVYVLHPGRVTAFNFWQKEKELMGKDALYVTHSGCFYPPKNIYRFKSIKLLKEIPIYRAGKKVRTFSLYHCRDFRGTKRR